jgi:flagellar assembly protein FliH
MAVMEKTAGAKEEPRRFLFDVEFERGAAVGSDVKAMLAAAEQDGYRRGLAEGEASANARIEKRIATVITQTVEQLTSITRKLGDLENRLEDEAVHVALAVARKLAPSLLAREPLAEVEALVAEIFKQVHTAPHVVIRVAEDMIDPAGSRLQQIADQRGFKGRLVLLPSPDLKADEVKVEWADGGIERDRTAVENSIDEAVRNYLARGQVIPAQAAAEPEKRK